MVNSRLKHFVPLPFPHLQRFQCLTHNPQSEYGLGDSCAVITSWQIDGKTMETVTGFIFLGSKITADGDYSHEIKRHLLLGRKAMLLLNRFSRVRLCATPWTAAYQAPLSMGFSRQECGAIAFSDLPMAKYPGASVF